MEVLVLYLQNCPGHMLYDQKCCPFSDHTVIHDLQLVYLVQRLRYVHHSQASVETPIIAALQLLALRMHT